MMVDFSVLFDRLGEQLTMLIIMAQRAAVQRQVVVILGVLLLAWAASRMLPWSLRLAAEPYHPDRPDPDASEGQPSQRASLRTQVGRVLQAFDFIVFPALLLLLTYRAMHWLDLNGWPNGLIDALLPIFWLLLVYRLLVRVVLAALPKDQSKRFASELLRPVVWILILLILRNILFSTLGVGEISLLRLGDWTINLGDLLDAAIVLLLALIIGGAVRKIMINVLVAGEVEADVANTVSNVARYGVVALGALVGLGILGVEIGALAWISGALLVGIGFGLQELIANFVSGIVLVFERIVRPGDVIEVDGTRGAVTKVYMRATVLQTPDNTEIVVPNKDLMTKSVLALTYSDRIMRARLDVSVAYDSDIPLVESVLLETIRSHPLIIDEPAPAVMVIAMDPHSVQLMAFGYVAEFNDWFRTRSELYQMVRDAFVANGIVVPYPRQDVRVFTPDPGLGRDRQDGLPLSVLRPHSSEG
jgi:small-conductance mechanosensitive channel